MALKHNIGWLPNLRLFTWVCDPTGAPVFMVMAEPNSSLVGELRDLVPTLRGMVGDGRRVVFGFDREGWSLHLFHELINHGFDPLTWRKGETDDVEKEHFTRQSFTDRWGVVHVYDQVADTTVTLTYGAKGKETRFEMRQISRIVDDGTQAREATGEETRQIHLLTGNTELSAAELVYRMSSRWRLENYF